MKQEQKPNNKKGRFLPMIYTKDAIKRGYSRNDNPFQYIIDMREESEQELILNIKHQLNRLNIYTLEFVACALTNDKDDKKRYNKCYPIKNGMITPSKKTLIDFIANQTMKYNTTIRS
jgi:hypothetical protein